MKSWPYQSAPYLSALPGVAAPGLDVSNGDLPSKIYFVNSHENIKKGGPDPRGPNCFSGTDWYCWYADQGDGFHKWIVPLEGGYAYLGKAMNTPERDNFDYVGHAAPGAGLFVQTANMRCRAGNARIWHMPSWVGDLPSAGGPDEFKADMRDGMGASSSTRKTGKVAHINCEPRFTMDESMEVWYDMLDISWIRGAITDPLHTPPAFAMPPGSHHEAGTDHGFGHLIGGRTDSAVSVQSLYGHTTDRNPLVAAPNYAHINNLHYNHGRPTVGRGEGVNIDDNGGHNAAAGRTMQANVVGCVSVRGPEQGDELVMAKVRAVTPGSSAHSAHNSVYGWPSPTSQDGFFKGAPEGYMKPTLRSSAWPRGLGFNYEGVLKPCRDSLKPTVQEGLAFTQLMRETVGCMPARRYLYSSGVNKVCDQIDAAIRGIKAKPQYINTVAQAGGWPVLPATGLMDPVNPNAFWHAPMPLGADRDEILLSGWFADGSSKVGYTSLRAWVIDQYFYVMGR